MKKKLKETYYKCFMETEMKKLLTGVLISLQTGSIPQ